MLEYFVLSNNPHNISKDLGVNVPNLKFLTIGKGLKKLELNGSNFPNLEQLNLDQNDFSDTSLKLSGVFPKLKHLDIAFNKRLTEKWLDTEKMAENFPKLEKLWASGTSPSVMRIGKGPVGLQDISMMFIKELKLIVENVTSGCMSLRQLSIDDTNIPFASVTSKDSASGSCHSVCCDVLLSPKADV